MLAFTLHDLAISITFHKYQLAVHFHLTMHTLYEIMLKIMLKIMMFLTARNVLYTISPLSNIVDSCVNRNCAMAQFKLL